MTGRKPLITITGQVIFFSVLFILLIRPVFAQNDHFPTVKESAAKLMKSQPAELWKVPTEMRSANIIQFIGDEKVLLGGILTEGMYSAPKMGPLHLLNAQTGEVIWTHERKGSGEMDQILLEFEPDIILASTGRENSELIALSGSDGNEKWSISIGSNPVIRHISEERIAVVLSGEKNQRTLRTINLEDGEILWDKEVEMEFSKLLVLDQLVIVIGKSVQAFNLDDGETQWQSALPGSGDESCQYSRAPGGIILWGTSQYGFLKTEDGNIQWSENINSGGLKLVTSIADLIILVIGGEKILDTDRMRVLNAITGETNWESDMEGLLCSSLLFHRNMIHFTIEDALIGFDPEDGHQVYFRRYEDDYARFNPVSSAFGSVPDILEPMEDLLVVDRDGTGLWAFNLLSGEKEWDAPRIPGRQSVEMTYGGIFSATQVKNNTGGAPVKVIDWTAPSPNSALSVAQSMHNQTMEQKTKVLGDQYSSAGERSSAISAARISSSLEISRLETQYAFNRAAAATEFASAVLSLAPAIQELMTQLFFSSAVTRERIALKALIYDRASAFQRDKYMSRFVEGLGTGILFVDLQTGHISKFWYEPSDPLHRLLSIQNGLFGLSPSGDRMVLIGLGIDPDQYQKVKKNKMTGVAPSILCFDPNIAKTEKELAMSASTGRVSKPFTDAVLSGDADVVRNFLEKGEDPNGLLVMENKLVKVTPIRMSVRYPEVIEVLLEYGARPISLEELPGLNAMDAVLTGMMGCLPECPKELVRSHDLLKEAGFKSVIYPDSLIEQAEHAIPVKTRPPAPAAAVTPAPAIPEDVQLYQIRHMLSDPEVRDSWKTSPVIAQAYRIDRELFFELVELGADVNAPVFAGSSLLHGAVTSLDKVAVEDFLKLGLDPNMKNDAGYTPMTLMFHPHNYNYVAEEMKVKMIEVLKILLQNGADPNTDMPPQPNGEKLTLLEVAQGKDKDFVKILKDYGATK